MKQILIALDQLINTLMGGYADETISARAYRSGRWRVVMVIDWLFSDPNHCRDSYLSEVLRSQLPTAYRNNL